MKGIDISQWQQCVDFARVSAQGVEFVFVKGFEADYLDPKFRSHVAGSQAAGLETSVYHFFRATQSPNQRTTDLWQRASDGLTYVALDVERPHPTVQAYAGERAAWADEHETVRRVVDTLRLMNEWCPHGRLVLYTGASEWAPRSYANPFGLNLSKVLVNEGFRIERDEVLPLAISPLLKLWWAAYVDHCPVPCWQWQESGSTRVDGITDQFGHPVPVDLDMRYVPSEHMFIPTESSIDVRQLVGAA